MIWLLIGLVIFLGVHSTRIIAPEWRRQVVAERGLGVWKGAYSVAALVGLVVLVWGYGQARMVAPVIYAPPVWTSHIALVLMLPAMILLAASQVPAGRIKAATRHPMLLAVKLWALAHLLANGDLASILMFVSFLAWAVADRISEKRRLAAGITHPVTAGPVRNDAIAVIVGLVLYVVLVAGAHEWLIGVAPVG
jgi:uncharacterized membrane protein